MINKPRGLDFVVWLPESCAQSAFCRSGYENSSGTIEIYSGCVQSEFSYLDPQKPAGLLIDYSSINLLDTCEM